MLGTILANKSLTKSSVTPGLDRSAISKACSSSSSGLLPLLPVPPRYLFDSYLNERTIPKKLWPLFHRWIDCFSLIYVNEEGWYDGRYGTLWPRIVLMLLLLLRGSVRFACVRFVVVTPVEILHGWRRSLLFVAAASLLLVVMLRAAISFSAVSVSLRLIESPNADVASPWRTRL